MALWKNYEIVLIHMLYCSHENVEFPFSVAVWGGDRLFYTFSPNLLNGRIDEDRARSKQSKQSL